MTGPALITFPREAASFLKNAIMAANDSRFDFVIGLTTDGFGIRGWTKTPAGRRLAHNLSVTFDAMVDDDSANALLWAIGVIEEALATQLEAA